MIHQGAQLLTSNQALRSIRILLLVSAIALSGCRTPSVGADTVSRDRFDYGQAVAESWKTQMLLNLVKLRYGDTPIFLNISSVVSSYTVGGTYSAGASLPVPIAGTQNTYNASVGGTYSSTPTISYSVIQGADFAHSFMDPVPPSSVLSAIQSDIPVDLIFRLAVQGINGINNRRVQGANVKPADPQFYELLSDFRLIQDSGDIGLRVDKNTVTLIFSPKLSPAVEAAKRKIDQILDLDPTTREFSVVYGNIAENRKQIALLSRPMLEVLLDLASSIDVPPEQVAQHIVTPTPAADIGPDGQPVAPLMRILSSATRPTDAFVATPYRGYWFYVDDRDLTSEYMFTRLMFLFTFVEPTNSGGAPVLTIPAH